ncbi:hypothetical protein GF386_03575 [Candidatus Pacearchaeota archaeon]|nr:hypothetical protein [Candidatus Pacearchaeota archaeon]MBD3283231.1 hypothetical protein [Candidatus Pacearchaeota archaeon]
MPHQCTHCGKVFPDAAEELLKGCSCGSRFFYYIKQEKLDNLEREREIQDKIDKLEKADKEQIEKDIREMTGLNEEPERPVVLDLESVRVIRPGKFEIDVVNLLSKKRPLIYKLEEGKYIIDLASSLKIDKDLVDEKIRPVDFPEEKKKKERKKQKKVKKKSIGEKQKEDKQEENQSVEKISENKKAEDEKKKVEVEKTENNGKELI